MNILLTLFMLGAFFIQNGYSIKCYDCHTYKDPNNCTPPTEKTCPSSNDRCLITKFTMSLGRPDGSVKTINSQTRGCGSSVYCTEAFKKWRSENLKTSGTLKSFEYDCCQDDLCNDGVGPYPPLQPIPPAFSCYECSPEGMGPNGTGQALISCKTPRERKCGDYAPGYPFDGCMTINMTVRNPKTGDLLEQQIKNCTLTRMMCSKKKICQMLNTRDLVACEQKCCSGNLCNGDPTISAGPIPGQTPLAISSIIAMISAVITLLF